MSLLTTPRDAADLVRTIFKAINYIHGCGIVHRGALGLLVVCYLLFLSPRADLKPENILFLTPAEDANIMIADFGLSRMMDDRGFGMLTEICGTRGVSRYSLSWPSIDKACSVSAVHGSRNI